MARVGCKARVTGRVQGVFFRAWTREQASELRLSGWVRNCQDGSVEALFSGEEQAVAQMLERLRDGPPAAMVHGLEVDEVEPQPEGRFEIRG